MTRILTIIMLAVLPMTASAQGFKGFVDAYCGTALSEGDEVKGSDNFYVTKVKNSVTFGLNVTEGYQIYPFLFAGIGFGGYANFLHYDYYEKSWLDSSWSGYGDHTFYSLYFPVYADLRWTLNLESTVTPFVDVKIGYQFGARVGDGNLGSYYYEDPNSGRGYGEVIHVRHKNGLYFMPSVGVRFGKATAFNLGIAYNPSIPREYVLIQTSDNPMSLPEERVIGKSSLGSLMLTLGAEF